MKKNRNILAYISSFLSERLFSVKLNEIYPGNYKLLNRIPQGSSPSVTLFKITNFLREKYKHFKSHYAKRHNRIANRKKLPDTNLVQQNPKI
ncbi:Reverse transcriptase domain-containing protein [Aphis craccivora]|uniref:Reverse transcriptase domain-containing protein n=1 Tax=Aphis craccivora TaxID=307492 RepID=A0A6G0Z2S6_APHCR|nr:Reverse transcriptase domain-containing protein [Aphis craccivora]